MKKVILLQPAVPIYRENFLYELAGKLNCKLYVFSSETSEVGARTVDLKHENIAQNKSLRLSSFFNKVFFQHINGVLEIKDGDVVIVNANPRYISNFFIFFIVRLRNAKIIAWTQGWSANTTNFSFFIRKQMLKFFDAVVLYAEEEKKLFKSKHFNKKIFALNNGINVSEIERVSRNYIASNNGLLFLGRVTQKSKFRLLLKAVEKNCTLKKEIVIHVVGSDFQSDLLIGYENIKVNFHGFISCNDRIKEIAEQCFAFVYPGAVGLSLVHAFAMGLPAVVHDVKSKHMPEIAAFKEDENGLLFEYNNPLSLCASIEKLFIDRELCLGLSDCAYQTVQETFNTKDMAKRMLAAVNYVKALK